MSCGRWEELPEAQRGQLQITIMAAGTQKHTSEALEISSKSRHIAPIKLVVLLTSCLHSRRFNK